MIYHVLFFQPNQEIILIHRPSTGYKQKQLVLLFFRYFFKLGGVVYLAIREPWIIFTLKP